MKQIKLFITLSLLIVSYLGFAQVTITGNVSDDNSLALPGATVVVEGTNTGVTTDFDGNYSISASVGRLMASTPKCGRVEHQDFRIVKL